MSEPTRTTVTTEATDEHDIKILTTVEEFASLDSYEATTNAKGAVQFHVKLYKQPGAKAGTVAQELADKLNWLKGECQAKGFTIAGDS